MLCAGWCPKEEEFISAKHNLNLDLSYIPTGTAVPVTEEEQKDGFQPEQLIAMGFPSEGFEGNYRNPMKEVRRFFSTYHKGHFRSVQSMLRKGV